MKQRGTILVYLVLAIVVMEMLYGLFAWVDSNWETSAGVKKGEAGKQSEWDEANRLAREEEAKKGATAATGLEVDRGKTKVVFRTITQTVDKIVERAVYRNVCLDDDGLRNANAALLGKSADPAKPDGGMPAPVGPRGRDGRGSVAQTDRDFGGVLRLRLETSPPRGSDEVAGLR